MLNSRDLHNLFSNPSPYCNSCYVTEDDDPPILVWSGKKYCCYQYFSDDITKSVCIECRRAVANGKKVDVMLCRKFAYRAAFMLIYGHLCNGQPEDHLPLGIVLGIIDEYPLSLSRDTIIRTVILALGGGGILDDSDYDCIYDLTADTY